MTWEIVTLICFTQFTALAFYLNQHSKNKEASISVDEFNEYKRAIQNMQMDWQTITKLAEETKKLLSEQNLAKGFGKR